VRAGERRSNKPFVVVAKYAFTQHRCGANNIYRMLVGDRRLCLYNHSETEEKVDGFERGEARGSHTSAAKHAAHIFLKQANFERAITGGGGDESKSVLVRAIMRQLDQLTYTERLRMIWQFLKRYIRFR
jgi:hypothetical protein